VGNDYRLYDLLDSPFCLKARICLSLKQVPYQRIGLTLGRRSELKRLSPLAKVPVLLANGETVADSSRIALFLEQKAPKPALIPRTVEERAWAHLIEEWADESLSFVVGFFKWLNPANRERAYELTAELAGKLPRGAILPLVRRQIVRRYAASGFVAGSLPHFEERMGENLVHLRDMLGDKPFLLGKYATLADIAVFAQLEWMSRYQEKRLLDAVPEVRTWMERLSGLDEIQQAIRGESPIRV